MPEPDAAPDDLTGLVSLLESFFSVCETISSALEYSKSDKTHVVALVHYLHAVNNGKSCLTLIKAGDFYSIPIVSRAVIESAASLANIKKSADYVEALFGDSMLRYKTDIKNFRDIDLPRRSSADKEEAIRIHGLIESLESDANKPKRKRICQKDKFTDAGMEEAYAILYSTFSGVIHGNLLCLFQEYVEFEDDGMNVINQNIRGREQLLLLSEVLLTSVFRAVESTVSILCLDHQDKIEELEAIIARFRREYI